MLRRERGSTPSAQPRVTLFAVQSRGTCAPTDDCARLGRSDGRLRLGRRGSMAVPLSNLGAITLFVDDLEDSKRFYRDVFGLRLLFEDENSAAFDLGNTMVNLLRAPAAE